MIYLIKLNCDSLFIFCNQTRKLICFKLLVALNSGSISPKEDNEGDT